MRQIIVSAASLITDRTESPAQVRRGSHVGEVGLPSSYGIAREVSKPS